MRSLLLFLAAAPAILMFGPMLQSLLAERFHLTVHTEKREMAVYVLEAAKGGPKLSAAKPGACVPFEVAKLPKPGEPEVLFCGFGRNDRHDGVMTVETFGATLDEFAGRVLARHVDRPILDRTGVAGRYDIRLSFSPDRDAAAPALSTALHDQLGLKLTAEKAPIDVIIVDSAQKPTEN